MLPLALGVEHTHRHHGGGCGRGIYRGGGTGGGDRRVGGLGGGVRLFGGIRRDFLGLLGQHVAATATGNQGVVAAELGAGDHRAGLVVDDVVHHADAVLVSGALKGHPLRQVKQQLALSVDGTLVFYAVAVAIAHQRHAVGKGGGVHQVEGCLVGILGIVHGGDGGSGGGNVIVGGFRLGGGGIFTAGAGGDGHHSRA